MPVSSGLRGGELNAAVTREIVRVHSAHLGRGPDTSFSFHNGRVVVTVLQDVMTQAERSLASNGEGDAVLALRNLFHRTMAPEMKKKVEDLTGREVVAFMSSNHIDPDMAVGVFVLDGELG